MDEPPAGPVPYRVSYSEWVRQELRRILLLADKHGRLAEFLNAVKEIDRRLHIYPQFGQPHRDLKQVPAQLWIGVVPPLVVRYTLDEKERLVMVSVPITPMNPSDFQ